MDNITSFINLMIKLHKNCNSIFISASIAQSIEESGFGTSNLYKIANASFGIKATSSWKGKVYSTLTKSIYDSYTEAKSVGGTLFRAYDSVHESVIDHDKFLQNQRYEPVRKAKDYKEACRQLQICGYCPEDGYANRLIYIIERYNLSQYDNLEFPFKIRVKYTGKDGVNVRKQPNYKDSSIDKINGPIKFNDVCTIVDMVDGFYKTKSGLYITSNPLYVERI